MFTWIKRRRGYLNVVVSDVFDEIRARSGSTMHILLLFQACFHQEVIQVIALCVLRLALLDPLISCYWYLTCSLQGFYPFFDDISHMQEQRSYDELF